MRVTILASGSGGNATLIQTERQRVLVDAGIGPEQIEDRMRFALGEVVEPTAIVLTHPHGDHACKAAACAARWDAPVYLTAATARRMTLPGARKRVFGRSAAFDVGALRVEPMPIPHDAPNVALVFDDRGARAATITDLGHVPRRLAEHLAGCQLVMLESNHDPTMLARGPYPEFLKRRIASRTGHLSNRQAARLLGALGPATRRVVLMHLSERCNSAMLALEQARGALRGREVDVRVAQQDVPLDLTVEPPPEGARTGPMRQLALPL